MSHPISRGFMIAGMVLATSAHVGSPDTYFEGNAGPYPVRVIVRNPGVVPGLAQITVRLLEPRGVQRVLVLPVYWDPKTAHPPPPDVADRVAGDSTLYSAALWLMLGGSYSVQVTVEGAVGSGAALVPVMAIATRSLALEKSLGVALAGFGALLVLGALTILAAAVREAVLEPGAAPDTRGRVRARIAVAAGAVVLALALLGGRAWWNAADAAHRSGLYEPLHASATVSPAGTAQRLRIAIDDTSWVNPKRQWTPLIPDHGHLMHLFLVRERTLDAFAHLHPLALDSITFETDLPPLPAGTYRAYADIVHESGFAQTLIASVTISTPARTYRASDPDDAWVPGGGQPTEATGSPTSLLADGSTMRWERGAQDLVVDQDAALRFRVLAPDGTTALLEPYMGMAGHAMLTREDGTVFVHLHPAGTISLAAQEAFLIRQPGDTTRGELGKRITANDRSMRATQAAVESGRSPPDLIEFPYAFPRPGRYHVWVQVKRAGRILTGVFDARVLPAR